MPEEEEESVNIKTLYTNGEEWMKIDDLIRWLKAIQKNNGKSVYLHTLIKAVIKMKNTKTQ